MPMTAELTPAMRRTIKTLAQRRMIAPVLLYLAGHRPLLFVAGQGVALAAPLAGLLGAGALDDWATLLMHPDGPATLQQALTDAHS